MPRTPVLLRTFYAALGAVIAVLLLLGSFSFSRFGETKENLRAPSSGVFLANPAFAQVTQSGPGGMFTVADVAERTLSSVVNISSTRRVKMGHNPLLADPFFREFFRHFGPADPSPRQENSLGSGVIVSSDGVIITNNHVVANADKIQVTLSDKREVLAKVLGTDPKSDLAVIKLKNTTGLRPIPLGDSDKIRLGDVVLAVGNPFGVGQTVTMGIVSAKGRANVGIVDYEDFIQTDAAINPGNSGGALVNLRGELVGINTAILSRTGGYQGIGFAIPTNMMRPIMKSLLKGGKVVRGWLGVVIQEVDNELAKAMKLPTSRGVLISDVDPSGPAAKAGLKRGDLVVTFNKHPVDSPGKLRNLVASAGTRSKVTLELYRDGRLMKQQLTLGEQPSTLGAAPTATQDQKGISVAPLTPRSRKQFNIPARVNLGVVITKIQPGTAASQAGLRKGDVILEVNRVTIRSVQQFHRLFSSTKNRVLLLIYRQGNTIFLILQK